MATKTLNTRIITKHADLEALKKSSLLLKEGEIVLAKVNQELPDGSTKTSFIAKVGNNDTFANSPWLFAKASDVYSWAKKSALAVSDIPALEISKITGLQDALNAKVDASVYNAKIAALEAAITGANTDAVAEAKQYADSLNSAMNARVKTIEDDYLVEADKTALQNNINTVSGKVTTLESSVSGILDTTNGIEAKAKAYTDTEVAKANAAAETAQEAANTAQDEVDALEGVVNTLSQTVATNKTNIEASLATEQSARESGDASTLADAKAHAEAQDAALHTTISAEIDADVKAAKDALDAEIAKKVDSTIYSAKITALETADTNLGNRLGDVEAKLADVTNVMDFRGAVTAKPAVSGYQNGDVIVVTEGDDAGKEFVLSNGEWVEFGSTSASDAAIAALQDAVEDLTENKADKTALATEVAAREAADSQLQTNINTLTGTVTDNKTAFDNYKTSNDDRVKAVEDKNATQDTAINKNATDISAVDTRVAAIEGDYLKAADKTELQGKIDAEATTRGDADTALGQRIDGVAADIEDVDGKLTTLAGRVTVNEGAIADNAEAINELDTAYKAADTKLTNDLAALTTRVGTAEGNITTINNTLADKADKTTVTGIDTRLAAVEANAIFDGDEIILDCGGAE